LQHGCNDLASQNMHACFTAKGAEFQSPGNGQLHLALTAIGRDAVLTPLASVRPDFTSTRVEYRHPEVTEWWRSLPVGYEQGFIIPRRPEGRGKLTLELATTGKPHQHGDDLEWQRIRYGDLEVYDSRRHRLPAKFDVTGDHIAIRVDDYKAAYPLTVDPLVYVQEKDVSMDGAANDGLGYAVAAFGNTVAVGAPFAKVVGNSSAGAVYLFSQSNAIWTQKAKLTAATPIAHAEFGAALAITGSTLVVGSPRPYPFGCRNEPKLASNQTLTPCSATASAASGSVYIFDKSGGGVWAQSQILKVTDALGTAGNQFGAAVAISGTTLVVGAPFALQHVPPNPPGPPVPGSPATTCAPGIQCVKPHPIPIVRAYTNLKNSTESCGFGGGSCGSNSPGKVEITGAAYVFNKSGVQWNQGQKLDASDVSINGEYGYAVAVDATNIAVGAPFGLVGSTERAGIAYVYSNSTASKTPPTWILNVTKHQGAELIAPAGSSGNKIGSAWFGFALAISGTHLAVGAPRTQAQRQFQITPGISTSNSGLAAAQNGSVSQGGAFYYTYKTSCSDGKGGKIPALTWCAWEEVLPNDGLDNDNFGWGLTLSGTTLYVGAPQSKAHSIISDSQGAVYVYASNGKGSLSETAKLIASDGQDKDNFAGAVTATGNVLILGAPAAKVGSNTKQGAVYFETADNLAVSVKLPLVVSSGANFVSSITVTNNTNTTSAPVAVSLPAPVGAHLVSATTPQGSCTLVSTSYLCELNGIPGNGGVAKMTLTLFAYGSRQTQVTDTASIVTSNEALNSDVVGTGTTTIGASPHASTGAQDLWSLGFLAWMVMLGILAGRRRSSSD
jgi:hypothetical protein